MNNENTEHVNSLAKRIAHYRTENADMDELEQFHFDAQVENLEEYSASELEDMIEDLGLDDE